MITKAQKYNAERIVQLADNFGTLHLNANQTVETVLNLSIPCARLIVAGIVTGVQDTSDGINDDAVAGVESCCREAVVRTESQHGAGWWTQKAEELL